MFSFHEKCFSSSKSGHEYIHTIPYGWIKPVPRNYMYVPTSPELDFPIPIAQSPVAKKDQAGGSSKAEATLSLRLGLSVTTEYTGIIHGLFPIHLGQQICLSIFTYSKAFA